MKIKTGEMYFVREPGSRFTKAGWLVQVDDMSYGIFYHIKMVDTGIVRIYRPADMAAGPLGPITRALVEYNSHDHGDIFIVSEQELADMKATVTKIAEATGTKTKKREFNLPSSR